MDARKKNHSRKKVNPYKKANLILTYPNYLQSFDIICKVFNLTFCITRMATF